MAPLSITNASPVSLWRARRGRTGYAKQAGGDPAATPAEAYALNLAKLIPGDTVALYTLLGQVTPPADWATYRIRPFLCCLVLVVFRAIATKRDDGRPRWGLVLISLATFVCWVYAQDDWFWTWQVNAFGRYAFNMALLTLAFVAPAFFGKDS